MTVSKSSASAAPESGAVTSGSTAGVPPLLDPPPEVYRKTTTERVNADGRTATFSTTNVLHSSFCRGCPTCTGWTWAELAAEEEQERRLDREEHDQRSRNRWSM